MNMASRPKRIIKAKKKDDEIYTSISSKLNKSSSSVVKTEVKKGKGLKRKNIVKSKLTDVNAAIYKRLKESSKTESDAGDTDGDDVKNGTLPRKRIPKPSFKLELEDESSDDYDPLQESDPESEDIDYEPHKTPKKSNGAVPSLQKGSSKKIKLLKKKKCITQPESEKKDFEVTIKEEQVDVMTVPTDKEEMIGKDKIIQLPNNRTYFEFAEPKKKVILQVKPPYESQDLKTQSLYEFVRSLKLRNMLSTDGQELLEAFRELPDTLLRINIKPVRVPKIFTEEVKKFATTLYVFAPRAYDLVNTVFFLPPKDQLHERLRTKNYWPGLTEEALEILQKAGIKDPSGQVCSIMVDFVPINKGCHKISNDKWLGHVDFCGGPTPSDSDEVPLASEILLLTVVGIGWDWKLPFGYFLTNGLSGEGLQSIIIEAIKALEETELKVKVIVCDGYPNTIKMGVLFGCNIHTKSFAEIVTNFPHPMDEKRKVHLVFGIRRALDLLRNLLADKTIFRSSTYGIIRWKFFEQLWGDKSKTKYGIKETLDPEHRKFYNMQRILRRCHPAFSCAENMALEFANELDIKGYEGSSATTNFVADIYRAFDLLNSRNPVTSGEKPPITNPFLPEQLESMTVIGQRIFGLEYLSGTPVISDGRWLSAMLFAFTLKSVSVLASELLVDKSLMYFTTYRVNLDHSDMILSSIQRQGGWEDTPTPTEFHTGYKRLLEALRKQFEITSFCSDFEGGDFTVGQGIISPFKLRLHSPRYDDIEFSVKFPSSTDLNIDTEAQGRCILRYMSQRLTCASCMVLLLGDDGSCDIGKKIFGDCVKPSRLIRDILKASERVFKVRAILSSPDIEYLVILIFSEFLSDFWKTQYIQSDHILEEPNHFVSIIKVIIRMYLKCKLKGTEHIPSLKSMLFRDI